MREISATSQALSHEPPDPKLRSSAVGATAWSTIDVVVRQGGNFLAVIVLARLLSPDDFGIIALVTFFSSLVIAVVQGSISTALIQRPLLSEEEKSAAFWWSLSASSILAGALLIAAPWIASFYKYPDITPLLAVAAAQVVLSSLSAIQTALLARELRFAPLAKAGIVSTLVAGALAIVAAIMGAGIWSLAIQFGVAAALNTVILWRLSGWQPSLRFSFVALRPLLAFGGYLGVSSFLEVLYSQGFALIVGKRHGPTELGLYNRAMALQLVPSSAFALIVDRIALPLFSKFSTDDRGALQAFRRVSHLAMLLNVPIMCGMAVLPDMIIVALYGERWISAAPILSILSVGGIFLPLHAINLQFLLSRGRADAFFWLEVTKKVAGILCIGVGSFHGMVGVAYGTLVAGFLALFVNTFMTKRTLNHGLAPQLIDLSGIFVSAGLMTLALFVARNMIVLPLMWGLPLLIIIGGATYFTVGIAMNLGGFRDALELASMFLKKQRHERTH